MDEMILEKAREMSKKIYERMGMVEACEGIAQEVEGKEFIFIDKEGTAIHLDRVLTNNQMENIRSIIITSIRSNGEDAEKWLKKIAECQTEEKASRFADGSGEQEEPELKEEDIQKMLDEGMTQTAIAKELGTTQPKVSKFIKKHNIRKAQEP